MNETQWREFLHKLSRLLLDIEIKEGFDERFFSPEEHECGYLGFDGASEAQIVAAETRLGARLPDSYRTFLKVSNGWPLMSYNAQPGKLWSSEELFWVRDNDPNEVMIWTEGDNAVTTLEEHLSCRNDEYSPPYNADYIQNLLSISDYGDASDLYLSPEVLDENGEWECWRFANWLPGAARYQSFEQWMLRTYDFLEEESKRETV